MLIEHQLLTQADGGRSIVVALKQQCVDAITKVDRASPALNSLPLNCVLRVVVHEDFNRVACFRTDIEVSDSVTVSKTLNLNLEAVRWVLQVVNCELLREHML